MSWRGGTVVFERRPHGVEWPVEIDGDPARQDLDYGLARGSAWRPAVFSPSTATRIPPTSSQIQRKPRSRTRVSRGSRRAHRQLLAAGSVARMARRSSPESAPLFARCRRNRRRHHVHNRWNRCAGTRKTALRSSSVIAAKSCHGIGGRIGRDMPMCLPVRIALMNISSVHMPMPVF